jgi:type I restriction enzyme S subunit
LSSRKTRQSIFHIKRDATTVRPNLNGVARVPMELDGATASTGFCVLRPKAGLLDGTYLFQWVKSSRFVSEMVRRATGASYPAVSDRIVCEAKLPLPALPEQRRIGEVLDKADTLRAKRRAALAQLNTIARSIFLDMFGDPASNPKGWPITTLGDLISLGPQNGLYKPASDYGTGTLILRIDAFYDGVVTRLTSLKRVRLSDQEVSLYGLRPGEIVINRVNSREYLGKSALVPMLPEPVVFESNMMRMGVDSARIDPVYLIQLLQTRYVRAHILRSAKDAVNQSSINQQDVKSIPVVLPPPSLQMLFTQRLRRSESLAERQRSSLTTFDALFCSLQGRAYRGEL